MSTDKEATGEKTNADSVAAETSEKAVAASDDTAVAGAVATATATTDRLADASKTSTLSRRGTNDALVGQQASGQTQQQQRPCLDTRHTKIVLVVMAAAFVVAVNAIVVFVVWRDDGGGKSRERAAALTLFLNSIKLSNGTLTAPRSSFSAAWSSSTWSTTSISAEQAALSWLVFDDPLQLWPNGSIANKFRFQQRYALLTLVLQLANEDLEADTLDDDECDWFLVGRCIESATQWYPRSVNVVTNISMSGWYFSTARPGSTLSPDLGLLSNLESFTVAFTNVTGSLPSSLGTTWTALQEFRVSDNALTGSLPSLLGTTWTNLVTFDVSDNALTGNLPSLLGTTWTNLATFRVSDNALTGSLPSLLGSTWSDLQRLNVSSNVLTGTIPSNWPSQWNTLELAHFSRNNLLGPMPSGFCTENVTLIFLVADCTKVMCNCCDECLY